MRVAWVISSSVTSRNSRSRFRRSPKFPLAMPLSVALSLSVTSAGRNLEAWKKELEEGTVEKRESRSRGMKG